MFLMIPGIALIFSLPQWGYRVFPEDILGLCQAAHYSTKHCDTYSRYLYNCIVTLTLLSLSGHCRPENLKLKEQITGAGETAAESEGQPEAKEDVVKEETASVRSKMEVSTPQKVWKSCGRMDGRAPVWFRGLKAGREKGGNDQHRCLGSHSII